MGKLPHLNYMIVCIVLHYVHTGSNIRRYATHFALAKANLQYAHPIVGFHRGGVILLALCLYPNDVISRLGCYLGRFDLFRKYVIGHSVLAGIWIFIRSLSLLYDWRLRIKTRVTKLGNIGIG